MMKKLFINPLFLLGLIIKLSLIALIAPLPVTELYTPFLQASVDTFSLDPWATWLNLGGDAIAFPYGYVMWLFFLPASIVCKLTGIPFEYGYGITLMITDIAMLLLFKRMLPGHDRKLLIVYWLSPIVIGASYLLGYNDLIPVLLLVLSLYWLKQTRALLAGLTFVAAISAKLSMVIALPFFLIYFLNNRMIRQFLPLFTKGLLLGASLMLLPFALFSHSGISMLLSNPEMSKVYELTVSFNESALIYLVPLVYMLMLYATWRVRRLNFELFNAMFGLAFLLVILATPASPGWFIWAIPLFITYQAVSDRYAIILVAIFSTLYALNCLLIYLPNSQLFGSMDVRETVLLPLLEGNLMSLIHTAMVAVGIIIAVRVWRETVRRNDYFRLSRKAFVMGIAGDSGAGKDTFSDAIKDLFGSHSVTTISGDDYHLWDRQKPMWQVMTHLNPMANDLEGFANDIVCLTDGRSISSRHYNHKTGRMSKPFQVNSNDFIIASGLHALYLPILRDCYNLSVYLDIDEELRRYFKLDRDVNQRGHTVERVLSSIEKREPDSKRFIRPQAAHADLVLSLQPINHRMLESTVNNHPLRFKLVVRSRHGLNELSLTRVLIGVCGLHVDMVPSKDSSIVELTIEGETSAQDIEMAAQIICPRIFEFLDINPQWQDGVLGLMQLITLSHINQAFTKRFI